jgi:membrane protease YdiL (CAAX protease family)
VINDSVQPQVSNTTANHANATKWRALLRAGLFGIFFFASLFLVKVTAGLLGLSHSSNDARGQWYGGVMMTALMLAITWIFGRTEKMPKVVPGTAFAGGSVMRAVAGVVCVIPLAALSIVSLKWLVPGLHFTRTAIPAPNIISTLALFIVLAAYEEIAFRGYPMRRLLCAFRLWPTLLLVALVFSSYHIVLGWDWSRALIGTSAGSMLFGMAAVASKKGLAFPIGVHAGWNFTTWCLGAGGAGIWKMNFQESLGGRVQLLGMCVYLACMLFGTLLLWFFKMKMEAPRPS